MYEFLEIKTFSDEGCRKHAEMVKEAYMYLLKIHGVNADDDSGKDMNVPTGWVSVKDRLPEVGKVVLAFGTRSATTGMFQGISKRNDLWWWKGHTIKHVSHWMPLPEPPKEDD